MASRLSRDNAAALPTQHAVAGFPPMARVSAPVDRDPVPGTVGGILRGRSPYTLGVSAKGISDELVRQVADDLRARYDLDDEDMRALAARLADAAGARSAGNVEFAERFTDEHRETFDRLAK